jgi:ADP-ribosylation factor 1/2
MGNTGFAKFFSNLFGKKGYKFLLLGVDAAGKTSLLYKMKLGNIVNVVPTIGMCIEVVDF